LKGSLLSYFKSSLLVIPEEKEVNNHQYQYKPHFSGKDIKNVLMRRSIKDKSFKNSNRKQRSDKENVDPQFSNAKIK
jgi:hypothetical protein